MLPGKNRFFFQRSRVRSSGTARGGLGAPEQLVTGIPSPAATRWRDGLTGKRNPKIILLEFHLQQGCPWGKITGAAYKKGLESAVWGKTRRETQG